MTSVPQRSKAPERTLPPPHSAGTEGPAGPDAGTRQRPSARLRSGGGRRARKPGDAAPAPVGLVGAAPPPACRKRKGDRSGTERSRRQQTQPDLTAASVRRGRRPSASFTSSAPPQPPKPEENGKNQSTTPGTERTLIPTGRGRKPRPQCAYAGKRSMLSSHWLCSPSSVAAEPSGYCSSPVRPNCGCGGCFSFGVKANGPREGTLGSGVPGLPGHDGASWLLNGTDLDFLVVQSSTSVRSRHLFLQIL